MTNAELLRMLRFDCLTQSWYLTEEEYAAWVAELKANRGGGCK